MLRTSLLLTLILFLSAPRTACSRERKSARTSSASALNEKQFGRHWRIEAEGGQYKVRFMNDTLELIAPKGLTLWRREKMKGNVRISYFARVMDEGLPCDRLSDLNCFWMANDPKARSVFSRIKQRSGTFANCYALQLYYVGYGGNSNTTTRFRRYDGNEQGIKDPKARPAILTEYTDSAHLLSPNQWYHIVLEQNGNRVRYSINGECIVDYTDPEPLDEGWFGFRTTWSRTQITGFTYSEE